MLAPRRAGRYGEAEKSLPTICIQAEKYFVTRAVECDGETLKLCNEAIVARRNVNRGEMMRDMKLALNKPEPLVGHGER